MWDILLELGYEADGLYLGLGIGDYSDESGPLRAVAFAEARGLTLIEVDLRDDLRLRHPHRRAAGPGGCRARRAGCPSATSSTRPRSTAATTSSSTGHNLDDEAAVLFGNVLRWQTEYLGRQLPVLPARPTASPARSSRSCGWPSARRRPTACSRGIDYIVEECPMAAGNRHLGYKEALNAIEAAVARARSTTSTSGSSREAAGALPARGRAETQDDLGPCDRCGAPTTGEVCAFCRLVERVGGQEPVPVELVRSGRRRR